MPRHGNEVKRFDTLRDIENGRSYQVVMVRQDEVATYYLTPVDDAEKLYTFSESEIRERFEIFRKHTDPGHGA